MKSANITITMEVDTTTFNSGTSPSAWCTLSQSDGSITIVPGNSSLDLSTVNQGDTITWVGSANVPPHQATVNITSIDVTGGTNPFGDQSPGTPGAYGTTVKATCNTAESGATYIINFNYNGTDYILDPKITVNIVQDEN
jgi:hypothetical protein